MLPLPIVAFVALLALLLGMGGARVLALVVRLAHPATLARSRTSRQSLLELALRRRLGHKGWVRVEVLVCLLAMPLLGCLGFGGPLLAETDEGADADAESDSESETGPLPHPCGPTSAVVDRVIDGDTIVLESGERVRYILVDTTEITDGKNECWGSQASAVNEMLVAGQTIALTYDVECEDQYGRLLAYVSVGDVEVNRTLVEQGHACVLHIPPNGDTRFAEFQALEDAARQAGLGMWGACATVPCD